MRIITSVLAAGFMLGTAAAAFAGATLTRQEARYAAGAAGYTYISHLKQDGQGDWTGEGHQGAFMVQPDGKVVALR